VPSCVFKAITECPIAQRKANLLKHYKSDNYCITCQDGDSEVMSHSNVLKYIKGAEKYEAHHVNQPALNSTFHTALSSNMTQSNNVPENYKDAIAASDVAAWMKACDVEMGNLRLLGCWEVPRRSSLTSPSKRISHEKSIDIQDKRAWRSKISQPSIEIVAKGYSQVQGLHYFESYAPAVYCECAEGYEDRSKYVYRLLCHLYGMKDSPRGWGQLFANVCKDFGLTNLKSDECFFVKSVNNSKSQIHNIHPNLAKINDATAFVPKNDRIYSDCPHATAILIIASYLDDNLAFTNCEALAAEFEVQCNVKI